MSVTREYVAAGKKRVNHIVTRWIDGESFEFARPGGIPVRVDGTGKSGPGPVDALLGALAACSSIDVVQILEKRRTPVASLEIEIHGDRADAIPARLTGIRMLFRLTGEGIEWEHAQRAVELAVNKYCSVRDSLDPDIPIELALELNGVREALARTAPAAEREAS